MADSRQGAFHGTRSTTRRLRNAVDSSPPATPSARRKVNFAPTKPSPLRRIVRRNSKDSVENGVLESKDPGTLTNLDARDPQLSTTSSRTPTIDPLHDSTQQPEDSPNKMTEARPKLTLKLKTTSDGTGVPPTPTPVSATAATPGGTKIKLKFKNSDSQTPVLPERPEVAQALTAKTPKKKTTKITTSKTNGATPSSSSKKRARPIKTEDDSEDELARPIEPGPAVKKLRLISKSSQSAPMSATSVPPTPAVRVMVKHKGKIPKRPLGVGYDSELDEREPDPQLEEEFILRMPPGPDCDLLRNAIMERTIGYHIGGVSVSYKALDRDGRRMVFNIQGRMYAGTLVDLPSIVEAMKSWDKKGWFKTADICQMLLILGRVTNDEEAKNYPLPIDIDRKTFQYAHGITPPMHWVRKRRFRKRASRLDIESVEAKVNELLQKDELYGPGRVELIDYDRAASFARNGDSEMPEEYEDENDEEQDAEGDDDDEENGDQAQDYFNQRQADGNISFMETPGDMMGDDDEDDLAAQMEAELAKGLEEDEDEDENINAQSGTPVQANESSFAVTSTSASPSAAQTPFSHNNDVSAEESTDADEDEDADEDAEAEVDEEEQNMIVQKERIAELQSSIKTQEGSIRQIPNQILRKKAEAQLRKMKQDLEVARKAIGEDGDDD